MKLAVFLDGTWQDEQDNTNVWQLYERTRAEDEAGGQQLRFYEEGVGAERHERLRGGIFGWGLDDQIRAGYGFLAERFSPGDAIYLFGFSRGATAARSLAGMITHCGLVHPEDMPTRQVYRRYRRRREVPGLLELRTGARDAVSGEDEVIAERSDAARIHFIGVFDTVGALGIPGGPLRFLSRRKYQFHDRGLSGLNDHAYHALGVDEHRRAFSATMWDRVPNRVVFPGEPAPSGEPSVEQRWFAGSHGNVGGGSGRPESTNPLSLITREWIAERAVEAGLQIDPPEAALTGREWRGRISNPYESFLRGLYAKIVDPNYRAMGASVVETAAPELRLRRQRLSKYRPKNAGFEDLVGRE